MGGGNLELGNHLFFQEDLISLLDKTIHRDNVIPEDGAIVVLHNETQNHHPFHHQLAVLRLWNAIQHHFHLQSKLQLSRGHLEKEGSTVEIQTEDSSMYNAICSGLKALTHR